MALDPVHVGAYRKPDCRRLKNAHGTRPIRWLTAGAGTAQTFKYAPPGAPGLQVDAVLGSTALAGVGLIGGTRFHFMQAVNVGAAGVSLRRWLADVVSTIAAASHGTVTITSGAGTNTLVRTSGDWTAGSDAIRVDDFLIFEGATTDGNNVGAVVTAVTATTLSFAASTFGANEALPVGAKIYRGHQQPISAIAANAGNVGGTPALNFLTDGNPGVDTTVNNSAFHLGPGMSLFVAAVAQIAAGSYVDLTALGGDL